MYATTSLSRITLLSAVLACALPAAPSTAQAPARAAATGAAVGDALVASMRPLYETVQRSILQSAEQMPADLYDFRPTPDVRSFGEVIGHVAHDQYHLCSTALGEENPRPDDFEETHTTKTELVNVIRASFAYCGRAYREIADAAVAESVMLFGAERTRLYVVALNIAHDNLHYGNLVTYQRMNGLVPPSSQPTR